MLVSDAELIADLRKEAAAWFNNVTLLKFEELLRRYKAALDQLAKEPPK